MRIRRSRLTGDFLQVPNATVRDDRLSHMARGILVELLSRPDGWEATADDMWRASVAKHGKASPGRRAFRAAFAELKEYGYLTAERTILTSGQHGTILAITDIPAGRTDVPHGGTSAPPAKTDVSPAHTDVPHAGTSESPTDVPHAGTSSIENELPNTGKKTSPSAGSKSAAHYDAEDRYPPELTQLQDAMSGAGINLPWKFLGDDMIRVINDISRLGIPLMVEQALKAEQAASKPPFSSRWFYDGWHAMRTPVVVDQPGGNVVRLQHAGQRLSTTDQRVQAALDLGRQMQAEYDATQAAKGAQ